MIVLIVIGVVVVVLVLDEFFDSIHFIGEDMTSDGAAAQAIFDRCYAELWTRDGKWVTKRRVVNLDVFEEWVVDNGGTWTEVK